MILRQLFERVPEARFWGAPDTAVSGLGYDSRRLQPGELFFAVRGFQHDGAAFVPEALAQGAVAVVSESPPGSPPQAAAWVQVANIRRAMALAAATYYGDPSRRIQLFGITGTNGKTTVAFLLHSILEAAAWRPALFGTIEYRLGFGEQERRLSSPHTTPESVDLQRMLAEAAAQGARSAVMEVSSHALALERVAGCVFHAAVFTNFSRDHLDFHGDMESYFAAKAKLFTLSEETGSPAFAVLNADDPRFPALRGVTNSRLVTYGMEAAADVTAGKWETGPQGLEFTAATPAGPVDVCSPLLGRHNVSNLLAAVASALTLEIPPAAISAGIAPVRVPGRMEAINLGQPFGVYVDYAHTPEALLHLLVAAREMTPPPGRVILVFGCGGERDRAKRPLMGVAAAKADSVVLTSDNPRSEDPLRILNDVTVGLQKAQARYVAEPDRARAIELALHQARAGDTVWIAGKGHETYQLLDDRKISFDDRETARAVLRRLGFAGKETGVS